jgi:acetyl-CoA C-acetyltransferase
MRDAVIVAAARTPIGRAYKGAFNATAGATLGALSLEAAVARAGIEGAEVDDVVWGAALQQGAQGGNIARQVALRAGLPVTVSGMSMDRQCSSGLMTIATAAKQIIVDRMDVVAAGGQESISLVQTKDMRVMPDRSLVAMHNAVYMPMLQTAETVGQRYGISREACDAYAVRSHQRAATAWAKGLFDDELVPVAIPQKKGDPRIFAHDEGYRADATMESLGALKALEAKAIPGAVVTAGNASQQNDAAAACLVVAEHKLEELGLEPIAWFHSWAAAGCDPARMGIGPVPAVERLFARTGLGWGDIDLVELNEAFAPQVLAVLKGWGWSDDDSRHDVLNVNGSGISLGHPIGATGGRILANLTRELVRRDGRFGLETMCIGGGQGIAAVFERAA